MHIRRPIFWLTYNLLARHLPRSSTPYSLGSRIIRAFVCKQLFEEFGSNVTIEPNVIFYNMSNSKIGDCSGIGMNSYIGLVKIGKNVMIGPELFAISINHEFKDINVPMAKQGKRKDQPIIIEDDVWIGARVIILPGITIGTGSIIGAGSVVTKNVAPFSIVAGNPATVIRIRK